MQDQTFLNNKSVLVFLQNLKPIAPIIKAIKEQGMDVFCVGGACRDLLLGREVYDLDLEVFNGSFERLEAILKTFTKTCAVGNRFLVIKTPKLNSDWALARLDGNGRLPEVQPLGEEKNVPIETLYAKAAVRRDLTVNSIGINLTKLFHNLDSYIQIAMSDQEVQWTEKLEICDPYGGLGDLSKKQLRAVDKEFFIQDPLRLFRVAQFYSRLKFAPSSELTEICKTMPINLTDAGDQYFCPYERIGEEFFKLMRSQKPSLGLEWLMSLGRWSELVKGLECFQTNPDEFAQTLGRIDLLATRKEPLKLQARFSDQEIFDLQMALLVQHAPEGEEFLRATRVDKQSIAKIIKILKLEKSLANIVDVNKDQNFLAIELKLLAKKCAPEVKLKEVVLVYSFNNPQTQKESFDQLFQKTEDLSISDTPIKALVDGNDALKLGIVGQEVKLFLQKAYEIQIKESIFDKEMLLKKLQ